MKTKRKQPAIQQRFKRDRKKLIQNCIQQEPTCLTSAPQICEPFDSGRHKPKDTLFRAGSLTQSFQEIFNVLRQGIIARRRHSETYECPLVLHFPISRRGHLTWIRPLSNCLDTTRWFQVSATNSSGTAVAPTDTPYSSQKDTNRRLSRTAILITLPEE